MNEIDAIFFLESMKCALAGSMEETYKKENKFTALATNMIVTKEIEALEKGIGALKKRHE